MQTGAENLELLRIFLSEANELLDSVEPKLIEMQQAAGSGKIDPETMNAIFRAFHSIKGSAHSLLLKNIATVAHHAESLLDPVRKGTETFTTQYASLLLKGIDFLRALLHEVERTSSDEGMQAQLEELLHEFAPVLSQPISVPKPSAPPRKPPEAHPSPPSANPPALVPAPLAAVSREVRERFVQEGDELLQRAEAALLGLAPGASVLNRGELVAEAMRAVHSLKGNCGFIGLSAMQGLSHKSETLLQSFQEGRAITPEQVDALLKAMDVLRSGVAALSRNVPMVAAPFQTASEHIDRLLSQPVGEAIGGSVSESQGSRLPGRAQQTESKNPKLEVDSRAVLAGSTVATSAVDRPSNSNQTIVITRESSRGAPAMPSQVQRSDIRVDLSKLDTLVNLVGELVIAESMVTRNPALLKIEDEDLERAIHHLRRILTDLQDVAMVVRMIPLSATFRKLVRLVHDLSQKIGKQARLELIGEETEVDKSVIELISDPLVHILRNALDHGLEMPAQRQAAGKPEVGLVTIEARHEGGEVVIAVRDDGRGLDRGKILSKAIERGLVRDPGVLSDRDILNLIFEPGFSTADKITDVSGRGVGLDVVRKNIEKLKGRIELHSKLGVGTSVVLRIPLTLAIIDGMLVRVGTARYTLPMLCIRETFRPVAEQITVTPDGEELVRVRDELIGILRLHKIYDKKSDCENLLEGILIVVESGGQAVALFVDEIVGQQQTVIKGLAEYLVQLGGGKGISGCTILGDGAVSLILDVRALIEN